MMSRDEGPVPPSGAGDGLPDEGTIHEWLDGALPEAEGERLEALAAENPEFAARVAEARGLLAASSRVLAELDEAPAVPAAVPAAVAPTDGSTGARGRASSPPRVPVSGPAWSWRRIGAVAAVLAVGVTGVWSLRRGVGDAPSRPAAAPSSAAATAAGETPADLASAPLPHANAAGAGAADMAASALELAVSAAAPESAPALDGVAAEPASAPRVATAGALARSRDAELAPPEPVAAPVSTRRVAGGVARGTGGSIASRPATAAASASDGDARRSTAERQALEVAQGYADVPGGRVFWRRLGGGPGTPLLALHGGPGGSGCRFEVLAPLGDERPVIWYDQLGSGRSEQPVDTSLWNVDRFVAGLDAVREALGLDSVILLGQSWGGALAVEYLASAPRPGVVAVVLSSPLISTPRWIADADTLRRALPAAVRAVLDAEEAKGTLDSPAYAAATDSFYARHVRRLPVPAEPMCEGIGTNMTVYRQMWGPTEFNSTGSLRTWSRADDLPRLSLPVLFTAGEFDEARPSTLREFAATMPDARVVVIEGAAHSAYRSKRDEYVAAVRAFLRDVERRRGEER
jgi:proline iminopeptidase